jgi:hypothetical protein
MVEERRKTREEGTGDNIYLQRHVTNELFPSTKHPLVLFITSQLFRQNCASISTSINKLGQRSHDPNISQSLGEYFVAKS